VFAKLACRAHAQGQAQQHATWLSRATEIAEGARHQWQRIRAYGVIAKQCLEENAPHVARRVVEEHVAPTLVSASGSAILRAAEIFAELGDRRVLKLAAALDDADDRQKVLEAYAVARAKAKDYEAALAVAGEAPTLSARVRSLVHIGKVQLEDKRALTDAERKALRKVAAR
jgi:hypothetical protein